VISDSNSADFDPSVLNPGVLVLNPGESAASTLTVSALIGAPDGNMNMTTVGVAAAGHASPPNVMVTTTIAPASPLLHNSITTASTKWAAGGGWGVPGGQYGAFVCGTCHTPATTNIKRVKETIATPDGSNWVSTGTPDAAVVFQSTTTPDGFGDDTGGHATSTKVCEVCHSQNLYHNYDTANNTGGLDHNNNTDCVECHLHKEGFKASCTACHGFPPVDAGTLVFNPAATGSVTAGAHNEHYNVQGIDCGPVRPTMTGRFRR
jgi:hypothetical protein